MPTDPFRAIAALARAEATRTTPAPRKPSEPTTAPEHTEPEPEPDSPEPSRTTWRDLARRIRRPNSA
jgi:hypothetical protein